VNNQPGLDADQAQIMREHLLKPGLAFNRYFFKYREGFKFDQRPHHHVMARIIDDVLSGKRNRVIINLPPGWSKTMLFVVDLVARGFAICPNARFLHASYNEALVGTNSLTIKDTMMSAPYQELWPTSIRADAKSKLQWSTKVGGQFKCGPAGGGFTGFRAGRNMFDENGKGLFSGAFIMDDMLKPDDANSIVERTKVNARFMGTFRSRLQHHQVPIIIVAQRLHENDLPAFLLEGGSGDIWDHIILPAIWPEEEHEYPKKFTHGNHIKVNDYLPDGHGYLPGESTWPTKEPTEALLKIRSADKYVYDAQYEQRPSPLGGGLFKTSSWQWYVSDPANLGKFEGIQLKPNKVTSRAMYGDTAMKTEEKHDFSVFQAWSSVPNVGMFLDDQIRGKWEASDLKRNAYQFFTKHRSPTVKNNYTVCRYAAIEDKASGTGLMQDLQAQMGIPVKPMQKNRDKISCYSDVIPYIDSGQVFLPIDADWITDFVGELQEITRSKTHMHDDQADAMYLAIRDMLAESGGGGLYSVA
jgi:predicted phage terminase large subunit-like protein